MNVEVHFYGYLYIMEEWIVFVYSNNKLRCFFFNFIENSIPIIFSLSIARCISKMALFGHWESDCPARVLQKC
jgi:hypothetical protein